MPEAREIAPGLLRWTAPHPGWSAGKDWPEQVGCVLYELDEVVALIDPLLPQEGRARFLGWLDDRIGGRAVTVLTTVRWHARDRRELAARYEGRSARAWNALPGGVTQLPLRGAGETIFWLERAQALVPGDSLVEDHGALAVCPESWLAEAAIDRRGLARQLARAIELPVERVLVSHGEPVLADGRAALARAVAAVGDQPR